MSNSTSKTFSHYIQQQWWMLCVSWRSANTTQMVKLNIANGYNNENLCLKWVAHLQCYNLYK